MFFFLGGGGGVGVAFWGLRASGFVFVAELALVFRLLLQLRDLVVASLQDRGQVVCFYVGAAHKLALPRRLGEQDDQDRSDHWGFRCCAVPTTITLGGTECGARPSPIPLVSTDTSSCRTACLGRQETSHDIALVDLAADFQQAVDLKMQRFRPKRRTLMIAPATSVLA